MPAFGALCLLGMEVHLRFEMQRIEMKTIFAKTMVSVLGAAMISTALVGCGGSSSSTPPSTSVNVTGGIATGTAVSNSTYDGSTTPVAATLSDGTKVTLFGGTFTSGETFVTIPVGTSILDNLFLDDGRSQGDVLINTGMPGAAAQVKVGTLANGTVKAAASSLNGIGLKKGKDYTVTFVGPFVIKSGSASLHVKNFVVYFVITSSGLASFPDTIAGQLPVDGGSTFGGGQSLATTLVRFPNTNFRLTITKSNGALSKVATTDGVGLTTFVDLTNGGSNNPAIPTGGVDTVELDYFATPF